MGISTIGLDLAKSVFQVHAINGAGEVVVRKALRRSQLLPFFAKLSPCLVGMEACGTSRELIKLGHDVRLRPPVSGTRGHSRRSEPDGAHRLGDHDEGRELPQARHCGRLTQ